MSDCPFCDYAGPSPFLGKTAFGFVIEPLNPVTEGHVLVIPRKHVANAIADPKVTGALMEYAARWARANDVGACNILTSVGHAATQTVRHLHVHIVPRRKDDGLALPWAPPPTEENTPT